MAVAIVGGNTAISVTGGTSTGYTIPSALSNSAAIAAGDLIALQINTADATNAIAVAGFTQIGTGNNDGSSGTFWRLATGTESAGWVFTCTSSFVTSYNFVVYRGCDAATPFSPAATSAHGSSTSPDTGSSTVTAGCLPILMMSAFSLTGTNVTAPTPSPSATLTQTCATNADRNFLSFFWEGSTTSAGALDYAATWSQNSNWEAVLIVLNPAATGGPTFSVQPADTQVTAGSVASFSVTAAASGGGTLTYQWQAGGVNVSTGTGGTTANYSTAALAYTDDATSYRCVVTETGGSNDGTQTTTAGHAYVGTIVVGANTPVYSTSGGTSVAPSYSTLPAIAAGDQIVLIVSQKPSSANSGSVTTPAGYTLIGSLTGAGGYSATLGSGTGDTNLFAYYKTNGATGSETGTFTVTVATNNVASATLLLLRPVPGTVISYGIKTGSDTTAGNVSITVSANAGSTAGDIAVMAFNGASSLATYSAEAVTTAGITYAPLSVQATPSTTTGNSIGGFIATAKTLSGASSAAAAFTATTGGTTTNARGPGVFLFMRATASVAIAQLNTQQRVKGFPRQAPLPGIVLLGTGILSQPGPATIGNGAGSAAVASFSVSGAGLVTFDGSASAALSPFAVIATDAVAAQIPFTVAQPQPRVASFGLGVRFVAPAGPVLGIGLLSPAQGPTGFGGAASIAISPFAVTASGLVTFASTGSAALSSFDATASGLETFLGASSAAASAFAASGSPLVTFTGPASGAASPFAATVSGIETFTGIGAAAASSFACSVSGAEGFTGAGGAACSPFAATGTGAAGTVFTSAATAALSPFAASSSGAEVFASTGSVACPSFAASSAGSEAFACSGSASLATFSASGNGATGTVFTSTGSAALSSFALSSTVAESFAGTASAACSSFSASISGMESFTGIASVACSPFSATGNGAQGTVITSSGSAALSSFAASVTAAEAFTGPGSVALPPFATSANGLELFAGSVSAACSIFSSSAAGLFIGSITGTASAAMASFGVDAACSELFTFGGSSACSSFAALGQQAPPFSRAPLLRNWPIVSSLALTRSWPHTSYSRTWPL